MPTADQITDTTPIVDVAAQSVWDTVAPGEQPPSLQASKSIARNVLLALVGHEDAPGPLDRYEVRAYAVGDNKPMVFWYCPRIHGDGNDAGHLGVIARNLDGDQTGLTLGEILSAVLQHERDEHDGPAI